MTLAGTLAASVIAGAVLSSSGVAAASSMTTLTLGVAAGNGPLNADIAKAKGYFTQAGLNVNIKPLTGAGAEAVAGLDSGSLTIVESNVVSVLQGAAHGINTPCFTGGVYFRNNLGTVLESAKSIAQPKDLAGKSIGVISTNSGNVVMVDAYLQAHHINYKSVHFVATGVTNTLAALKSGAVQGAELVAPFSTEYLKQGGHLLEEDYQNVVHTPLFACWTALRGWIGQHTAVVKNFIGALNRADAFYAAHPAAGAKAASTVNGLPPSANMQNVTWTNTTEMTGPQIEQWINLSRKYGVLTKSVTLSQVYDPIK
jgi:ABC-type nitrate/sulfonate/bicarbonate transport system substrate-binding protein